MQVNVVSREKAIDFCRHPHLAQFVMISISNPYTKYDGEPFTSNTNNVVDILRLSFVDADGVGDLDVYGKVATKDDIFSDKHAKQIVEFAEKYKDYIFIVHCDAGISRSAGVGAAILKHYTGDDSQIFGSRRYAPNMLVYYKILKAFGDWGFAEEDGDIEVDI
jgi:predicted protein tyrosine phosphatase